MKHFKRKSLILFLIFGWVLATRADDPPGFNANVENPIPIDGGVTLLLAAGAAYGIRRIITRKRNNSVPNEEL